MSLELIKTYSFYTSRNQRIAAYCRHPKDGKLEVIMLMCSAKDHFSKKWADEFWNSYNSTGLPIHSSYCQWFKGIACHPKIVYIDVTDKPKKTFLEFMELNFYRKGEYSVRLYRTVLFKAATGRYGEGAIPLGKLRCANNKLDHYL